jgi:hypothetical protein
MALEAEFIRIIQEEVPEVTRAQSEAALRQYNGDVVNAIMELSMGADNEPVPAAVPNARVTELTPVD